MQGIPAPTSPLQLKTTTQPVQARGLRARQTATMTLSSGILKGIVSAAKALFVASSLSVPNTWMPDGGSRVTESGRDALIPPELRILPSLGRQAGTDHIIRSAASV
ncbi:hypothetical protein AAur_pTC10161 (plasmid) [Paenarthrobacter aurescens TC1]|uniref:Uncharacterized protein n=2 Tax=Paenarthrobacter aurescens TaxID=43663 RepID=Q6SK71_PAEAU|nr:hypothetical protein [Paenarthrobacter aurescens]ABM10568.1 hypothetical protein AAur_pTC10161 [Paenarthrobacter aurescens TC1]